MSSQPTPGQVAHFSINADNVTRAKNFYAQVFGWQFHAYGPPGFYMVETNDAASVQTPLIGSLQERRELVKGIKMHGFECTIAVQNIDETISRIETNDGKIVMPKCTLPSIGHLCFFEDPEGNLVGAMQYDPAAE